MMQGTDKQVTWATDIRRKAVAEATARFERTYKDADAAGQGEAFRRAAARTLAMLEANEDAAWWINNVARTDIKTWLNPIYQAALAAEGLA